MKKVLIISFLFILCGCNASQIDIQNLMKEKEYIIIDVRTKEEYEKSHIIEAINIPYDEINEDINLDKDKTIFVYCQSGKRSAIVFNNLSKLDYTVYDLGSFDKIDLPKE